MLLSLPSNGLNSTVYHELEDAITALAWKNRSLEESHDNVWDEIKMECLPNTSRGNYRHTKAFGVVRCCVENQVAMKLTP
jgi:hypothetical protein